MFRARKERQNSRLVLGDLALGVEGRGAIGIAASVEHPLNELTQPALKVVAAHQHDFVNQSARHVLLGPSELCEPSLTEGGGGKRRHDDPASWPRLAPAGKSRFSDPLP